MSGPSTTGRITAVVLGLLCGSGTTYYFLKDFELVKRLDDPEKNEARPFKVSFRQSQPLSLKPEARARIEAARAEQERLEAISKAYESQGQEGDQNCSKN